MDYRPLGRTGMSVSRLCLGTMMLGAFGNPDHDGATRIIDRALDAGINFPDALTPVTRRTPRSSMPPTSGSLADEAGLTLVQMAVACAVRHPR